MSRYVSCSGPCRAPVTRDGPTHKATSRARAGARAYKTRPTRVAWGKDRGRSLTKPLALALALARHVPRAATRLVRSASASERAFGWRGVHAPRACCLLPAACRGIDRGKREGLQLLQVANLSDGGRGEGVGGEGGGPPAGRVRGAGRGGRAAGGAQHADGDGAARHQEGHRQGRPGALGAGDGGGGGGGVPPAAAAQVLLPRPARRRRREPLPPEQQGSGLDMPPARQGVRVHDVRDDGGSGAGVRDRAGRRARAAVDQALQHLHPLLRADRRQPRARDAGRRGNRRPLRGLRAQRLPPLLAGDPRRALALGPKASAGPGVLLAFSGESNTGP